MMSLVSSRRCNRDGERAFTLLEALITTTLLVLVIAVGVPNMRQAEIRAESKAVATMLAEELRLARQKAMAKQIPVGIAFPSNGGTNPTAKSFYILEGATSPGITRTVDYSRTYPSAGTFIGYWDLEDGSETKVSHKPPTGSNSDDFDVSAWNPPDPAQRNDPVFIFTPAGSVKTNGLPFFKGSFHIVVTQGVSYEVGAVLPAAMGEGFMLCFADLTTQRFCRMTGAYLPFTVNISPAGNITVVEGVTGAAAGIEQPTPVPVPSPAPAVPMPANPPNSTPSITDISILPAPNPAYLATLAAPIPDATVKKDGHLTLTVKATDGDGDSLYCKWSADGAFSSGEKMMQWNASENKWVSLVEWRPSLNPSAGQRFRLTCTVDDKRGGTATTARLVEVRAGKITFMSEREGNFDIYSMNADGTLQMRLTNEPGVEGYPHCSPDGNKIVFMSDRDGNQEIYVMNADGTGQKRLTNEPATDSCPHFSPDGSRIAFTSLRDGGLNNEIYIMNADGTGQTRLTNHPDVDNDASFSPDGTRIVFHSNRDGNYEIYIMNADGTNATRLTSDPASDYSPSFSPDGTKIVFQSIRDGNWEIYSMNADGTGQTRLTSNPAQDASSCFSPDGSKIAFVSNRDGDFEIYMMNNDGTGQMRLTSSPAIDSRPKCSE
jgi:WD40 repeat protein/type II secretory pathway pseudopilin PulG